MWLRNNDAGQGRDIGHCDVYILYILAFISFCEISFYHIAQNGLGVTYVALELEAILLTQPAECLDYKHVPPCPVCILFYLVCDSFFMGPKTLKWLSHHPWFLKMSSNSCNTQKKYTYRSFQEHYLRQGLCSIGWPQTRRATGLSCPVGASAGKCLDNVSRYGKTQLVLADLFCQWSGFWTV